MPLEELLREIWIMRWRLAQAVLMLFALCAAVVMTWPRSYVARAVVAPLESTGIATTTLLAPASTLIPGGGLLDNRPGGNFAIYLDALRSAEAVELLARETALLGYLGELRGRGVMGAVRNLLGLRREADLDDARAWLDRNLAVTQSVASITFAVELKHQDRAAALDALQRLHRYAEAKVRSDLAELTGRRIAALRAQLEGEPDLYVRQSLYDLLNSQQRARLVVGADRAVAARVVSMPSVEQRASVPNRPLLLLLLAVAVPLAVVGAGGAAVLLGWRYRRRPPLRSYPQPMREALRRGFGLW
jgi:hypothetical protein